ncbi:hypothetical protein DH2020_029337 [Rehmannia glutinosa]|uniref:Transcription initiation factor IIA subunit 2 n=1 Tax=Rehmannia glutinosa TaxID=99300 RepID=A0ABR0VRW6_REHGL
MATFELYRKSTIGSCLTETLDDMVTSGIITPQYAFQVLIQFDKYYITVPHFSFLTSPSLLQGHLHTYRFCDNVWTFILHNAQFKTEEGQEIFKSCKIVACDSDLLTQ